MESLAAIFVVFGFIVMGLAGVRYWRADLVLFFVTPIWNGYHRRGFQEPGWALYLLGTALSLGGSAILVVSRVLAYT